MGDFISRNGLITRLRNASVIPFSKILLNEKHKQILEFEDMIKTQPTVYDVEKVIDKLKENEQEITRQLEESAKNAPDAVQETNLRVTAQLFRDYTKSQIEIVKSGGIDSEQKGGI